MVNGSLQKGMGFSTNQAILLSAPVSCMILCD